MALKQRTHMGIKAHAKKNGGLAFLTTCHKTFYLKIASPFIYTVNHCALQKGVSCRLCLTRKSIPYDIETGPLAWLHLPFGIPSSHSVIDSCCLCCLFGAYRLPSSFNKAFITACICTGTISHCFYVWKCL